MKLSRQEAIKQIIKTQVIETQSDLAEALKKAGFNVTQATVSRDIKVNSETGTGYYEVEATITARGGTDGKEDPEFIQGMAVKARLVTGEKSVLEYLLEKIDLVDE